MSDTKNYYYLKLKDDFFSRPEIKIIKSVDSGHRYVCLLLEMYLRSIKTDGKLIFDDGIPYDVDMLSSVLSEDKAHIVAAIAIFRKYKLIEILDDNSIYMMHIHNYIGKSSSEGDRIREYRKKINENKQISVQMYDERTPELEIELEIKKEIDIIPSKKISRKHDALTFGSASGIYLQALTEFVEHRKKLKKPMTQLALDKTIKTLEPFKEDDRVAILDASIQNGWQGIFPDAYFKIKRSKAIDEKKNWSPNSVVASEFKEMPYPTREELAKITEKNQEAIIQEGRQRTKLVNQLFGSSAKYYTQVRNGNVIDILKIDEDKQFFVIDKIPVDMAGFQKR